jgi:uridine phosphorylase
VIVFDVVQIVAPGAITSVAAGRWLVDFREVEAAAEQFAAELNAHVGCIVTRDGFYGISYTVEAHDEESPERAEYYADFCRRRADEERLDAYAQQHDTSSC